MPHEGADQGDLRAAEVLIGTAQVFNRPLDFHPEVRGLAEREQGQRVDAEHDPQRPVVRRRMDLLGRRIDALRIPFLQRPAAVESDHGAWARLARAVMRRPVVVATAVVVLLLVVASPFLGVKWGSVDYRVLPADTPSHQASERLNEEFGKAVGADAMHAQSPSFCRAHVCRSYRSVCTCQWARLYSCGRTQA